MLKTARIALLLLPMVSACPLLAQGIENSGNHLLNGRYYFRHVLYGVNSSPDQEGYVGDISPAIALYGEIDFDGNGNYTIPTTTQIAELGSPVGPFSNSGSPVTGTYTISASGFGYLTNPVTGDNVFGLVSANGVFTGSSTEATQAYNDMFVAALMPSPTPGNSFFNGSYSAVAFLPGGSPLNSADAFFQLNPNGSGGLGTVNMTGYYGSGGTSTISQFTANVNYFFSSGAAVVTFPTNNNANFYAGGNEYLYFSPDGNFFFGGSPDGFDMIVGVRNPSGVKNFAGLYYNAGVYQDESQLGNGYAFLNGYYGSFNATAAGSVFQQQRISDPGNGGAYGSTFADSFTPPITGTYTNPAGYEQYTVGAGGAIRIGLGVWPYIGIDVGLQAPTFSGPAGTPYLNPAGIVNAASFSPFTAGVSDGEFLTLFGTDLAPDTNIFTGAPFPNMLDGVQVTVNGTPAPIYYVMPGELAIVAPFATSLFPVAQIQVNNNGVLSNTVDMLVNSTTPGVFTFDSSGLGHGAIEHADGSLVTSASPAQPGETVVAFVSGLGTVSPTVPDGTQASGTNLSYTYPLNDIAVNVDGISATVTYEGLAPYLIGLYQLNIVVPTTAAAGDDYLEVEGYDSDNLQALIPVGSGATAAAEKKFTPRAHHRRSKPLPAACFFNKCSGPTTSNGLSLRKNLPAQPAK